MEGKHSGAGSFKNAARKAAIVILPIIAIAIILFIMFPTKYYFKISDGKLSLWERKIGWLDAKQSPDLAPIPVGDADFSALTQHTYKNESEALASIRDVIQNQIDQIQGKLFPMERELVGPYNLLANYLRAAQIAGEDGLDEEINAIERWLDYYKAKVQEGRNFRPPKIPQAEIEMKKEAAPASHEAAEESPETKHGSAEHVASPGKSKSEH